MHELFTTCSVHSYFSVISQVKAWRPKSIWSPYRITIAFLNLTISLNARRAASFHWLDECRPLKCPRVNFSMSILDTTSKLTFPGRELHIPNWWVSGIKRQFRIRPTFPTMHFQSRSVSKQKYMGLGIPPFLHFLVLSNYSYIRCHVVDRLQRARPPRRCERAKSAYDAFRLLEACGWASRSSSQPWSRWDTSRASDSGRQVKLTLLQS